jgi:putative transcriptional regulator
MTVFVSSRKCQLAAALALLSTLFSMGSCLAPAKHQQKTSRRSLSFALNARQRNNNDDLQRLETQFHPEGGDWRTVRAKLIAQEQASDSDKNPAKTSGGHNVEQVIGSLFSRAMESITKNETSAAKKNIKATDDAKEVSPVAASQDSSTSEGSTSSSSVSREPIFYDDFNPTIPSEELLGQDPAALMTEHTAGFTSPLSSSWAHELAHVEPGCVLVANEFMKHDVYKQSVILMVNHSEKEGSMGLVLCSKKSTTASTQSPDLTIPPAFGGPLHSNEYLLLHAIPDLEGAVELCPGVFCGGQVMGKDDSLTATPLKLFQGRAVWSPNQLEKEISQKQWYVAATSPDLIWNPSWEAVLTAMGGKFRAIADKHGNTKRP